ncbi:calcineurin [Castilleja foliolosa]|uniref:Calcineurin B-like protein n=1 Tax=Castilleja foliolosa TaxID=1961234 RepID=A0ABD3BPG6_9LAMI
MDHMVCLDGRNEFMEFLVLTLIGDYEFSPETFIVGDTTDGPIVMVSKTLGHAGTMITVQEIKSLNELFVKLGSTLVDDGFLNREEFNLGLFGNSKHQSLFGNRVENMFDMFDSKHDGVLDFGEFIDSLNIFHPRYASSRQSHLFTFKLYDIQQTGYIEKEEVMKMVTEFLNMSNLILSDDIIEEIVDKTFEEANIEKDGKIDMEEWKQFVAKKPSLLRNMTIPYLKDIPTTFPSFEMS